MSFVHPRTRRYLLSKEQRTESIMAARWKRGVDLMYHRTGLMGQRLSKLSLILDIGSERSMGLKE